MVKYFKYTFFELAKSKETIVSWNFMFFINSILLGIGLAMDAFSVSIANGLAEPEMKNGKMNLIAGTFGFFQALMPMIGWACVCFLVTFFKAFEKFIPWCALILLLFIGGKMLIESMKVLHSDEKSEENAGGTLTMGVLIVQGIATAIDALSVGFTIADYGFIMALVCSLIIAVVTYAICMAGLKLGKSFGNKLSDKAGILGGCILIFIGVEIFVKGVFL